MHELIICMQISCLVYPARAGNVFLGESLEEYMLVKLCIVRSLRLHQGCMQKFLLGEGGGRGGGEREFIGLYYGLRTLYLVCRGPKYLRSFTSPDPIPRAPRN